MMRKIKWALFVTLIGLVIIFIQFHGILNSNLTTSVWGISASADPVGNLMDTHDLFEQFKAGCIKSSMFTNYPFGEPSIAPYSFLFLVGHWPLFGIYYLTDNLILSYNLGIIFLFLLNFLLCYYFFHKFVKNKLLSLLPSVVLTFSTYTFLHSFAHLGLLPVFFFPAFIYFFISLHRKNEFKYVILSAFVMTLAFYSSQYYGYLLFWSGLAIFSAHIFIDRKRWITKRLLIRYSAFIFTLLLFCSHFIYLNFIMSFSHTLYESASVGGFKANETDMRVFSARPIEYFMPNPNQFLYGDWVASAYKAFSPDRYPNSDEFAVQIGLVNSLFFLFLITSVILFILKKYKIFQKSPPKVFLYLYESLREDRFLSLSLLFILFVSFILSFPDVINILGLDIYLPNVFLKYVIPFRAYSRFVVLFLTALSILLALFLKKIRHQKVFLAVFICFYVFETTPKTMIHPADFEYFHYLKGLNEKVIVRLSNQYVSMKRITDFERVMTDKYSFLKVTPFNDPLLEVSLSYKNFSPGILADMGAELLLVNGRLSLTPEKMKYLQLIKYFEKDDVEIYKIIPENNKRIKAIFDPIIQKRKTDPCYVLTKGEMGGALVEFVNALRDK